MDLRSLSFVLAGLVAFASLSASAQTVTTIGPEWLSREFDTFQGRREAQVADRAAWFREAVPRPIASEPELLLCRVHVEGSYDLFADPDLLVVVQVGARRATVWGSENSRTEIVSLPAMPLRRGATLRVRVVDRDPTFDEPIGTVSGRVGETLPIALSAGRTTIECRGADPDRVRRRLAASLENAATAIAAAAAAQPDASDPGFGRPSLAPARAALIEAAAYGGFHDRAVSARRRELGDVERRFERALREALRRAAAERTVGAPEPFSDGHTIRLVEHTCARRAIASLLPEIEDRPTCALILETSPGAPVIDSVELVDDAGSVASASLLRANGTRVVAGFDPRGRRATLARIGRGRRTLLRVR